MKSVLENKCTKNIDVDDQMIFDYLRIIYEALDEVNYDYYKFTTTYGEITRERVFCYELYHQIRCIQDKQGYKDLVFNGEVDKRGHNQFKKEDQKNPDFVFHRPGAMEYNTIVMEVKGALCKNEKDEYIYDIKKLITFVRQYEYKLGVFLAFDTNSEELIDALGDATSREFAPQDKEEEDLFNSIILVCKKAPGTKHKAVSLLRLINS